jgi:hypothetical protein
MLCRSLFSNPDVTQKKRVARLGALDILSVNADSRTGYRNDLVADSTLPAVLLSSHDVRRAINDNHSRRAGQLMFRAIARFGAIAMHVFNPPATPI